MLFTAEVVAALQTLRDNAINDFERHRIDILERDLTAPPAVEIVDDTHQRFNGVQYRELKDGHYASSTKMHRDVWQYYNGNIPNGCVIHHVDCNPSNNESNNLQCLTKAEHAKIHSELAGKMPPPHTKIVLTCINCGRIFAVHQHTNNGFCSPKCRMSYRFHNLRETRICQRCGKEFSAYKYNKVRFCSKDCRYTTEKIVRKTCPVCSKEFTTTESHDSKCCSHKCASILMWQTNRTGDRKKTRKCLYCGKDFVVNKQTQQFCSKSCVMKYRYRKI